MPDNGKIEECFNNLDEMLKFFQKIYGKKKGIEHYNNYWNNIKIIEECKPIGACIVLGALLKKGGIKYVQ